MRSYTQQNVCLTTQYTAYREVHGSGATRDTSRVMTLLNENKMLFGRRRLENVGVDTRIILILKLNGHVIM
jgi:hypothetical protein